MPQKSRVEPSMILVMYEPTAELVLVAGYRRLHRIILSVGTQTGAENLSRKAEIQTSAINLTSLSLLLEDIESVLTS